jgi:hypothetical protein
MAGKRYRREVRYSDDLQVMTTVVVFTALLSALGGIIATYGASFSFSIIGVFLVAAMPLLMLLELFKEREMVYIEIEEDV